MDLIYELIEIIKRHNIKGMFTTNGTIFPEDLAIKMVDLRWDFIHFSVDGPDADTHDELRGVEGSFNKVMKAIQLLNYYKERLSVTSPIIDFNTVLSAKNYHTLPHIFELAKKCLINHVTIIPVVIYSEKMQELNLNRVAIDILIRYLKEAKYIAERLNISSNIGDLIENYFNLSSNESNSSIPIVSYDKGNKHNCYGDEIVEKGIGLLGAYCLKPWYHIAIQANGDIGPCCNFQESKCNILHKNLESIWFGDYFNKLRELMIRNCPPPNCLRCGSTLQSIENRLLAGRFLNSL